VCSTGRNYFAHLTYGYNGCAMEAARFTAEHLQA
jgi:hypothetical protein